jgi:hypothetical protein
MKTHVLSLGVLLVLAACGARQEGTEAPAAPAPAVVASPPEMNWARVALERNPSLEVLAADPVAGVFTVRERGSGTVRTVKLADLAAAPVEMLAQAREEAGEEAAVTEAPAAPEANAGEAADESAIGYTVERSGGQVRVSGPGVSIVSAGGPAASATAADAGPHTVDPIIREGDRVMQLNDRSVVVTGDAVTARNGCQLHITNSRISATGTGVVIRDATVHITNSTIEGGVASFDAGAGAKVFLQGATMKGTTRRDERAEVREQGNNQWH